MDAVVTTEVDALVRLFERVGALEDQVAVLLQANTGSAEPTEQLTVV